MENGKSDNGQSYFNTSNPTSAKTSSGRRPETPGEGGHQSKPSLTITRSNLNPTLDSTVGKLPGNQPVIRVIWNNGQTKVLDIKGCRTADEIMLNTLRKLSLPEHQVRNYCFFNLDGVEPDPEFARRLNDIELVRICNNMQGNERNRLILRKIHAGEPSPEELRKAASIALEELNETHQSALANNNARNQLKIQKLTGETWDAVKYPLSPATFTVPRNPMMDRGRPGAAGAPPFLPKRTDSMRRQPKPLKQFLGARPPSELISQELTTYFPDHKKDEIERTVSMSQRRSARLSRAQSRLSIASNISFASSMKDAPPLPNIADAWLSTNPGQAKGIRPLSVAMSRFALPNASFRDSIASTALHPLAEESPTEPNRKSYVSFDSTSDANINVTDHDAQSATNSYFDESGSSGIVTEAGTLQEQYRTAIAEDGEGPDEELDQFLKGDSWDNVKWMQGSLIGQGSFGSVFLALHAITGELMAVKQVGMPSKTNSDIDKRKEVMVAALKREIDLLRDLQHPHIVQYLGSNCDDEHFNIFLEYVPGGSVAAMLNSYGQLQEPLIRNFVRQILDGLSYLHGQDIIHRDIKGANVLVDNKGNIKISDFGISKRVEASALLHPNGKGPPGGALARSSLQGSVFWMAPEVVKQTSYTLKADIWSLGCLIVEMFTGTHPFPNCSQLQAIFQIGGSGAKPSTPENASEEGKEFLRRTFEIDYELRPTARELMGHEFLKQIA
jgi:mitogen-activated protein kinase kinase kinase